MKRQVDAALPITAVGIDQRRGLGRLGDEVCKLARTRLIEGVTAQQRVSAWGLAAHGDLRKSRGSQALLVPCFEQLVSRACLLPSARAALDRLYGALLDLDCVPGAHAVHSLATQSDSPPVALSDPPPAGSLELLVVQSMVIALRRVALRYLNVLARDMDPYVHLTGYPTRYPTRYPHVTHMLLTCYSHITECYRVAKCDLTHVGV